MCTWTEPYVFIAAKSTVFGDFLPKTNNFCIYIYPMLLLVSKIACKTDHYFELYINVQHMTQLPGFTTTSRTFVYVCMSVGMYYIKSLYF